MQRKKRTPQEAWEAIIVMIGNWIIEEATPEDIDEMLREDGYDPDEVVANLRARIGPLLEKLRKENT